MEILINSQQKELTKKNMIIVDLERTVELKNTALKLVKHELDNVTFRGKKLVY